MVKKMSVGMLAASVILLGTACGKTEEGQGQNPETKANNSQSEPVTLTFYNDIVITESMRQTLIVEPIREKYPHIKLEFIDKSDDKKLDKLIAAGVIPDIIYTKADNIGELDRLGLKYDLNEQITKQKFDLKRIEAKVLDSVKTWGDKGEIYGIPYTINFRALYYNKGLFDRFGVTYPKDGMTWDETIELAKKVTRKEEGSAYRGVGITNIYTFGAPYSLPFVDAKSEKSAVDTDGWKRVFTQAKAIYDIPGNEYVKALFGTSGAQKAFMKDGTLAMFPEKQGILEALLEPKSTEINWDIATYPSFKELPGLYGWDVTQILAISSVSKSKEQAFQALSVLLSDKAQLLASQQARVSPLTSSEVKKAFGSGYPVLKGKNVQGILKSLPAKPPVQTVYDGTAQSALNKAFQEMLETGKDVNTTLRTVEEAVNKAIQAEKIK